MRLFSDGWRMIAAVLSASQCQKATGAVVNPEHIEELRQKIPEWQNLWNVDGVKLLKEIMAATGKQFRQQEMIATLFICPKWRSMSSPYQQRPTGF
ncbi:MAG: hypothetical protein AB7T49_02825 [Oligoflexales bacterium]